MLFCSFTGNSTEKTFVRNFPFDLKIPFSYIFIIRDRFRCRNDIARTAINNYDFGFLINIFHIFSPPFKLFCCRKVSLCAVGIYQCHFKKFLKILICRICHTVVCISIKAVSHSGTDLYAVFYYDKFRLGAKSGCFQTVKADGITVYITSRTEIRAAYELLLSRPR